MPITIKIKENGPYLISLEDSAAVVIVDGAGQRYQSTPGKGIALCRCGQSSTKPFCDRTHRAIAFQGALGCLPVEDVSDPPPATTDATNTSSGAPPPTPPTTP